MTRDEFNAAHYAAILKTSGGFWEAYREFRRNNGPYLSRCEVMKYLRDIQQLARGAGEKSENL